MSEPEKYETIISLLKQNNLSPQQLKQLEMQFNRLAFFQFFRKSLKTNAFSQFAYKYCTLHYLKIGQVYKHQDELIDHILIVVQGQLNLYTPLHHRIKATVKYRILAGQELFKNQIYQNNPTCKYKILAVMDTIVIHIAISSVNEMATYGFNYQQYQDEFEYFSKQFPDVKQIELIPLVIRVRTKRVLNNQKLYHYKSDANTIYFLIEGEVELYTENENGKQSKITVACLQDSFGEECLFQGYYSYGTQTSPYKQVYLYELEVQNMKYFRLMKHLKNQYQPQLLNQQRNIDQEKVQSLKESNKLKNRINQVCLQRKERFKYPFNSYFNKLQFRFIHAKIFAPNKVMINKLSRAISMNDSGLFNFMELNNPGKNASQLMKYHIRKRMTIEQVGNGTESEEKRNRSYELSKYWNLVSNQSKLPIIRRQQ